VGHRLLTSLVIIAIGSLTTAEVMAADETVLDQLTATANNGCLSGNELKLIASASGNLSFVKTDGMTASVVIIKSPGAGTLIDDNLRLYFNRDIQACLKPYTDRIIDYILEQAHKPDQSAPLPHDNTFVGSVPLGMAQGSDNTVVNGADTNGSVSSSVAIGSHACASDRSVAIGSHAGAGACAKRE
jgi:hypothetical protein